MYRIIHLPETDSTNTYLKNLADTGEDICVIADRQTGGRGRLGRTFESPEGGLYMSFTCHVEDFSADTVTARAAVAVSRAVERLTGLQTGIKWVNDIYVNGRKLCGILAECVWNGGAPALVIIGVGVNLYGELPQHLSDIATTVSNEGGTVPDREELATAIFEEFAAADDFRAEYKRRQILLGRAVTAYRGDDSFDAVAEDLDDGCAMILRLPDGTRTVLSSGEVSIRGKSYEE